MRHSSGHTQSSRTLVLKVIECSECGERFAIGHDPACPDLALAERQAAWLQERFVWDHIQETKHRGSIALPGWDELK